MDGRVTLRPFSEEEYHAFFRRYVPDPVIDPNPFVYNREMIDRSYRYNYGGFRENYAHFGVFLDSDPVGNLQLKRIDRARGLCEIGIILRDEGVKDRGIGTQAVRLAMQKAKDEYGLQKMAGDTMGQNKRMIRVFEKLGFRLTERVEGAFSLPDGSREDRLVYEKTLVEDLDP